LENFAIALLWPGFSTLPSIILPSIILNHPAFVIVGIRPVLIRGPLKPASAQAGVVGLTVPGSYSFNMIWGWDTEIQPGNSISLL